jgi:hypothetical protein
MRAGKTILMVLVLLLGGCTEAGLRTATGVYTHTNAAITSDGKRAWIQGPTDKIYFANYGASGYADVFLRTLVKDKHDTHQLYVAFRDEDWVYFSRAYDSKGNELKFIEIKRRQVTGGITEHFAATLSDDYLQSATRKGLEVKFVGKRGERQVSLRPHYVKGYLKKYRELTATR